jgi:CBS-domain-containing membrane protein
MLVEEVMSRDIVSIDCNKTVLEACKVYSKNKVGSLVVMDKKIIVGIVTERDTVERVILQNKNPKKTKVKDIMSPNIITVHALAPLERAAQIMKESNIKKLPVILNNEIVGIVTETDLSRTIDAFSGAIEELIDFYTDSKNNIENIMNDWGNLLIKLQGYKKLAHEETDVLKKEV